MTINSTLQISVMDSVLCSFPTEAIVAHFDYSQIDS